jgi:hypothetical protein
LWREGGKITVRSGGRRGESSYDLPPAPNGNAGDKNSLSIQVTLGAGRLFHGGKKKMDFPEIAGKWRLGVRNIYAIPVH